MGEQRNKDETPQFGEPWPNKATPAYVVSRLCAISARVWESIDPDARTANDCCCQHQRGDGNEHYRHEGRSVLWLESMVNALAGIHDPAAFVAQAKQDAADLRRVREALGMAEDADFPALAAEVRRLREIVDAAKKFIDSHVADPDITREMREAWWEYQAAIAAAGGGE
jgi:hypothetical protein